MNILLVDDERYVLDDLLELLDWEQMGFQQVFTACNQTEAQEIFRQHSVQILVSDIEMPLGDGFELWHWVREHYPKTACIFLTCHADFSYAQKALKLEAMEYLLKPVQQEELELAVKKAVMRMGENSRVEVLRNTEALWNIHRPVIQERFWKDLLQRREPLAAEQILPIMSHYNVTLPVEQRFCPVLIKTGKRTDLSGAMEIRIKETIQAMIAKQDYDSSFFFLKDHLLLGLIAVNLKEADGEWLQDLTRCLEAFQAFCTTQYVLQTHCYIGAVVALPLLPGQVKNLEQYAKNMFSAKTIIHVGNDSWKQNAVVIGETVIKEAVSLIRQGHMAEAKRVIGSELGALADELGLNYHTLALFRQDFLQAIYRLLDGKGYIAHQLFQNETSLFLSEHALDSFEVMMEWLEHVIDITGDAISSVAHAPDIVSRVRMYIQTHLNEDLSRESIAACVYLNPDYLDRIFKENTSMTVMKYLGNERIALAQMFLVKTDMPIRDVAISCGYNSLTNFSVAFRKITGETPSNWRKQYRQSGWIKRP
ncbi:hypothetical protein B5F07_20215 [Lachnoclostridium sp. An169]|uniref:response regulator n=1 Tax=Lachnoclostridium sp. An169 TaxID=1965569 RepID=UPI000B36EC70|nr:response regulator [Lachnoclostridium sp. An169]OUP80671.1 hypothetical protein B5F07_20215 [Lachnoclostridium sp. An169]